MFSMVLCHTLHLSNVQMRRFFFSQPVAAASQYDVNSAATPVSLRGAATFCLSHLVDETHAADLVLLRLEGAPLALPLRRN